MTKNAPKKDPQREGRLLLAVNAIKKGQFAKIREAARLYDVPTSTLHARLHGRPDRSNLRANSTKLSETEENSLKEWIISMNRRGAAPRPSMVQDMADLLLSDRGDDVPALKTGKNWVSNFLRRNKTFKTKFIRKYNYQRAQCENRQLLRDWFIRFQETIAKYGILDEDIYNFDETGFAMGVIATAKVVTMAENLGKPVLLQPGNREWVTVIEAVNSAGWAVPPVIIFKGKVHIESWYNGLPRDWSISVSPNGWTSDDLGLQWLKNSFDPYTKCRKTGRYRMLVLDGHGSHLTPEFDRYCDENDIVPICMPAHSSHLLQPLDVGCFAVLKRSYGRFVESMMRDGIHHIDKLDFLSIFPKARAEALKTKNVAHGFAATGLVPYDPGRVLAKLHIQLQKTPTPPGSSHSTAPPPWVPETPHNVNELRRQSEMVKTLLRRRTHSPPSPINEAFGQIIKCCLTAMHETSFKDKEISDLRAAIEHLQQKRTKSTKQLPFTGIVQVQDGIDRAQALQLQDEVPGAVAGEAASEPKKRAPPRCSNCNIMGHRRNRCPQPLA